jgi:formylglycine-generating enzyme required for sulfatase activity
MSNESKPQEWFYLRNETWNGPFKTSGLKELVKKGLVDPSTLLRIGITGVPIRARQVKSLFPNYQGAEQPVTSSIKNKGILNNAALIVGAILITSLIILFKSNGNVPWISLGEGISSIEKEMVLIPSGKFKIGSPKSEKDRSEDETQHEVTLTKSFYVGKYEVTQGQWEGVMGNNPSKNKGVKLPVTNVSWEDCQEFIKKLNAKTKGGYRLPTEAEWEYACRAGTTTAHSFGDSLTKSDANILDLDDLREPPEIKPVGSYKPNAFGLYDMHGNVYEWCEDWYGDYPKGEVTDPKGPGAGKDRVLRGGGHGSSASLVRSSRRSGEPPTFSLGLGFGFRLARTADVKAAANVPRISLVEGTAGNVPRISLAEGIASIEKEMALIPSGKFMMGDRDDSHEVTLTKSYYMGKYEVTQEQWEAVMGNNPSEEKGKKLPVTDVSWNDCQEFIKKLNAKTDGGYRLPTEAEWEYACRAGTTTAYSFGDKITPKDANYYDSKIDEPVAVGSYKPNAFGLYDMHGNVWEWCEDWKADYPAGAVMDPKGPATGKYRVLRGGSYVNNLESFDRSSLRFNNFTPTDRFLALGFRLARTADLKAAFVPPAPKQDPKVVMPATVNLLVSPFNETKAKEAQKEIANILQKEVEEKVDLGKSIKLDLVLIPAGKFKMGDQGKDHEVTLTKSFYMGKYEVTQRQWEGVMGNNPSTRTGANLPVTDVSWVDCQEFIKTLNAKTNGVYRLPTEAEWEYACRAGTTTAYAFGESLTRSDANIGGDSIKDVESYKPNAFGIYNMHGNVWEWCNDWHEDYPAGAVTDPKGPATGQRRVLRGGSFFNFESKARSSLRDFGTPTGHNTGFRLARTADLKAAFVPPAPKPDPAENTPATVNLLVASFTEAKAKEVQKLVAKSLQKEVEEKVDLGKGVKLDLVLIPAGKFVMGSPESENGRKSDETRHEVTLTKPFYICKYETTQEQYESVMGSNPSSTKGAKLPVTNVSWEDCQEFVNKLNASTKGGYRLPTEAEWEFACRAATSMVYSYGDSLVKSDANIDVDSIKAVGSYKANAFGLYDMHGNVWEWCEGWYGDYPVGEVTDPKGAAAGTHRVLRGGSFHDIVSAARSSNRNSDTPSNRFYSVGFRLARTP